MATIRVAGVVDAGVVAHLLDTFNREYDTPTPGIEVLERRLDRLLAGDIVTALLIEEPPVGLALVTLRPNIWYDGPVGLLDELYVAPDRRNLGLGTVLLRAAEDVVRRRGGEVLEINVDGDDVDARRFYERHGSGTPSTEATSSSSTTSVSSHRSDGKRSAPWSVGACSEGLASPDCG